jgi:FtsZ-interacting cell division protein YlmF
MNFFRRNGGMQDMYIDGFDEEPVARETAESTEEAPQRREAGGLAMTVVSPQDFSEASDVAKEVLRGVTVVLNLDRMNKESCRRLLDFLGGVVYALDGGIKKVAASTYIVTPTHVDIYDSQRGTDEGEL